MDGNRDDLDAIGTELCRAVWGAKYETIARGLEDLDPDPAALVCHLMHNTRAAAVTQTASCSYSVLTCL